MRTLSFTPGEWQSLCHCCRWIHVAYFHQDSLQRFLTRCLAATEPELAAKVQRLSEAQLNALHVVLKEDQLSRFGMGQPSQTR